MIELGPPIVKGGWCEIRAVVGQPDLCAKVLIQKRRFKGGRPDPNEIVSSKYGIRDFLEYEWTNYKKIIGVCPEELRRHFVRIHGIETTQDGVKSLVMDVVRDDRGEIAPSLVENTRALNPEFFSALERIRRDVFVCHAIDHFGIVPRNILVKSPDCPIFIDFQTGKERYKGQFWLRWPFFVRAKINRCFRKLYKEMGIAERQPNNS